MIYTSLVPLLGSLVWKIYILSERWVFSKGILRRSYSGSAVHKNRSTQKITCSETQCSKTAVPKNSIFFYSYSYLYYLSIFLLLFFWAFFKAPKGWKYVCCANYFISKDNCRILNYFFSVWPFLKVLKRVKCYENIFELERQWGLFIRILSNSFYMVFKPKLLWENW